MVDRGRSWFVVVDGCFPSFVDVILSRKGREYNYSCVLCANAANLRICFRLLSICGWKSFIHRCLERILMQSDQKQKYDDDKNGEKFNPLHTGQIRFQFVFIITGRSGPFLHHGGHCTRSG
jgi:hypothetical protein